MTVEKAALTLERVRPLSWEHILPIVLAIGFFILIIRNSKHKSAEAKRRRVHLIAICVALTVAGFHLQKAIRYDYNIQTDLPLYLCSLLGLLIPIYTYFRTYWMFEILVFWIIAGTLQGVLTPDIAEGFPSLDYFRYWMVHLGLLGIIFYEIFIFKLKPKFKSVFISFGALQVYVILMMGINYILDANYFYLNEKPKSASLLDHFGDWPFYLVVAQLIVLPLFLVIYLPFYLSEKRVNVS